MAGGSCLWAKAIDSELLVFMKQQIDMAAMDSVLSHNDYFSGIFSPCDKGGYLPATRVPYPSLTDSTREKAVRLCEQMCLRGFITQEMGSDFALILKDFMEHCYSDYSPDIYPEYARLNMGQSSAWDLINGRIIDILFFMAKDGHPYAKKMFLSLYRTYYKQEARQLRKFRKVALPDVVAMVKQDNEDISIIAIARILTLCPFLDIELDESCDALYSALLHGLQDVVNSLPYHICGECSVDDDVADSAREEAQEMLKHIAKPYDPQKDRALRPYRMAGEFIEAFFSAYNMPRRYAEMNRECADVPFEKAIIATLIILRNKNPKRKYTFEQVQTYAAFCDILVSIMDTAEYFDGFARDILSLNSAGETEGAGLYKPNPISLTEEEETEKGMASPDTEKAPPSKEADETLSGRIAELEQRAAELEARLRKKEEDIQRVQEMYANARSEVNQLREEASLHREERDELMLLREEAAQRLKEKSDAAGSCQDVKSMSADISGMKIVIIGGHNNWTSKLKNRFPGWVYIPPQSSGSFDDSLVRSADRVYFFSDHISHSVYDKYKAAVTKSGKPFGYIHGVNIDANIKQIYFETLAGENA